MVIFMLKRKIYFDLLKWKQDGANTALMVVGARQIGKSTTCEAFGKENYRQFIKLNFIEDPQAAAIFSDSSVEQVFENLTAYTRKTVIPGETLILLDEIQEAPEARTKIKFLVQDHRADIIETGSLLGVNYKNVQSYPVGFETILPMYPMDFEEFCWANRIPDQTLDLIRKCYKESVPCSESIHNAMLRLFYSYIAVGGMPKVVSEYVQTHDFAKVVSHQKDILDLYRHDISKYAEKNERIKIMAIFDSIPGQLRTSNRFILTKLGKNSRMQRYENSFLWLEEAGVGLPCYNVKEPVSPLRYSESRSLFRLYLCDTGLLCSMGSEEDQFLILQGNVELNAGSLLENVFAQSIRSKNLSLYYFDSTKRKIELDFLIQDQNQVDVLEIKSGSNYQKHTSLDKASANKEWPFKKKIVFCKSNVAVQNGILYLPFYMIFCFDVERMPESKIWEPDLSALFNMN